MESAVVESTPKNGSSRSDPPARANEPPAPVAGSSSIKQEPVSAGMGSNLSSKASSTPSRATISVSSRTSKCAAYGARTHSSTQIGWAAAPSNPSVSSSRPSTPSRRPTISTLVRKPSSAPVRPSPVNKTSSLLSKSVASRHPSSAATKARHSSAHPISLSETRQESPPNLQTPAAGRPLSNSRGSMVLKINTTASVKKGQPKVADAGAKNRGLSSSPLVAMVHVSLDSFDAGKPMSMVRSSSVSGKKKSADKIVSRRKPVQSQEKIPVVSSDAQAKNPIKSAGRSGEIRSTTRGSSGFGRNLSRTSLDMAIRHMGNSLTGLQPLMSNVRASSLYGVRSRNGKGDSYGNVQSVIPITSSPMASSSAASSEHCMSIIIDRDSSVLNDEMNSEMGSGASPGRQSDRAMALYNERKVTHWLGSSGGAMGEQDEAADDIMQNFEHELVSLSGPESPLVSQPEGIIDCDDDYVLDTMY